MEDNKQVRAGVAKTKANMEKWRYQEGIGVCECSVTQSAEHLLKFTLSLPGWMTNDLALANEKAISIATY